MGLNIDLDIQEDMKCLIGEDALELTVIPREKSKRQTNYYTSDTGADGDESEVAHSVHSEKFSESVIKTSKYLTKRQQKRECEAKNVTYKSSSENDNEHETDNVSHSSLTLDFEEMKFDDLENNDQD